MLPAMVTLGGVVSVSQGEKLSLSSRYRTFAHIMSRARHQLFWVTGMSIFPGIGSRFDYSRLSFSPFTIGAGGLTPCIFLFLSFFYPRKRLQIRYA